MVSVLAIQVLVVDLMDLTANRLLQLGHAIWYAYLLFCAVSCGANFTLDTIYACQDIRDDKKMGVRSTAIRFGRWIRPILTGFGLAFVAMLAVAGILNKNGPLYFAITVGGAFAHLAWQYATVDLDDPKSCGRKLIASVLHGRPILNHFIYFISKFQAQRPAWVGYSGRNGD